MKNTIIRPMTEADFKEVVALENMVQHAPWTVVSFKDCLKPPNYAFVLELEEHAIGFGVISVTSQIEEAQIMNIAVAPEYQKQGLGKKMLLFLIDLAKQHHIKNLFLEVRKSNKGAFDLYTRLGFNEIGIRKQYYRLKRGREDAIIMGKTL
ncbi:MAG: ribosomal protein S18-alanine N-acetyltransferase [Gammaproteobacteria bacterium]